MDLQQHHYLRTNTVGAELAEAQSYQLEAPTTMTRNPSMIKLTETGDKEHESDTTQVEQCQLNNYSFFGLEEDGHNRMQAKECSDEADNDQCYELEKNGYQLMRIQEAGRDSEQHDKLNE